MLAAIERRTGLTANGLVVAALAVALFAVARALGSPGVFMLCYGAIAVVGLAYVLARRRLVVTAVRTQLPTRVRLGQAVTVGLSLTARSTVTTVVVSDELPDALGTAAQVPVARLPAGQEMTHEYLFTARRRGVYDVGPLTATWTDPFTLTRRRQRLADPVQIIVHPRIEPAYDRIVSREWEDPPVRPPVTKPWPTGFEFSGLRDYVTGDDPRRIVWRATARTLDVEAGTGRYLVRESEQGITDRVSLVLDTSGAGHSPGTMTPGGSETFETAVRVIASVASRHLSDGMTVSVWGNSGRLMRPVRGQRDRVALLDALARVEAERVSLRESIERIVGDGRRDRHVVVVTASVDNDVARRLRLLLDRAVSVLLVMVVWERTDPITLHRAARIGCPVVEVHPGAPLGQVLRHIVMQVGAR
jgi:uncharacterized protein (DUF58 family)